MRKLALAVAATAAVLCAGSLLAARADAMTAAPAGVKTAIEAINPVDNVACWRYGWHGWGWYHCGYRWNWRWHHRRWWR